MTKPEETIFADALELAVSERADFVRRACGDDAGLHRRVEALLRAYEGEGARLEESPLAVAAVEARARPNEVPVDYAPGARVGRYKILQKIGEGGCGVIFLAEQTEPLHRRVALKVIKLGMDTREVIARFEAERQALALMDHPNIARVLDAGATESGRPYFVMELVRGVPITRHCDEHRMGTEERIQLFIKVCHAIQHAHHKGIIHRDLKPSNILVTMHDGVAVPKIIDFGIAKATQGRLTDRTVFTAFEQFIGTPAYMSPEQTEMSALDVDTRSDIYSLGVLLYELLTGRTPFDERDLSRVGADAMRRVIREEEPAKPSTRFSTFEEATRSTVARLRGTEASRLQSLLRGDLDWIVMRCLEKDRNRRYETANGLAMDLARHRNNEPIVARPPGTLYVVERLIRRNKLAVTATCAVLVALLAGLAIATWAFMREREARQRADLEAARSVQVARFMQDMLAGVRPQVALGRDTRMLRAILDETVERLNRELRNQPAVEADLRASLGNVYRDLDELRPAALMHETALRLHRETFGVEHVSVAESMANLAETLARQNRLAEAGTLLRDALAMRERLQGHSHTDTVATRAALANVLLRQRQRAGSDVETTAAASLDGRARHKGAITDSPPSVIRFAHTGGRATGQTFNSGNIISTADQMDVLENEFQADGIRVEWLYFPGGPATSEAIARNQVDFASLGAFSNGSVQNQKLLLRVGSNGSGLNFLITRADAPFGSLADLKGHRIGTVKGTAGHLHLCRILEHHGYSQRDFTIQFYEGASALSAALQAGEVDGYYMTRPFELVASGKAKVIHDAKGEVPPYETGGRFLVSTEFEREHPEVVQRVVNTIVKLAAWHSDDANRDAILAVWARAGRDQAEMERSWADRSLKERYSPLLDDYFLEELRRNLEESKRFGLLPGEFEVDIGAWAEPKYLWQALKDLRLEGFWPERDANGRVHDSEP